MLPEPLLELLDTLPDGIVVVAIDGRIVAINGQLIALSGYRPDELEGRPVELLVPARSRAEHVALRNVYTSEGAGSRPMSLRPGIVLRCADGTELPVDVALSTMKHDDIAYVIASVRDATLRRRAEETEAQEHAFQLALHEISAVLLAGRPIDATLRTIAAHARSLLSADFAMVTVPTQDTAALEVRVAEGLDADGLEGALIPAERSLAATVMRDGEPVLLEDAETDEQLYRPEGWPPGLGPALFLPLLARDEVLGSLAVAYRRERPMFAASDVVRMKTFAAHAAMALADARAQERLRRLQVLEDRDRVAAEVSDTAIRRISSVALTLHTVLQQPIPDAAGEALLDAIDELDAAITAIRSAILPR